MRNPALLVLGLCACSSPTDPSWAIDTIDLEREDSGAVNGFHTWSLYADGWSRRPGRRHYVCSVVVQLDGEAMPPDCSDCTLAWKLEPSFLETDCTAENADDPRWLTLEALAVGPVESSDDLPHPDQTLRGWADYGDGWVEHGWSYPAHLDTGAAAPPDGLESLLFYPLYAWEL